MSTASESLEDRVAQAIDRWHADHPDLTVQDILKTLESIRFKLTDVLVNPKRMTDTTTIRRRLSVILAETIEIAAALRERGVEAIEKSEVDELRGIVNRLIVKVSGAEGGTGSGG